MGIVRKILGEEKPTKEDLLTIRNSVEEEISDERMKRVEDEEVTSEDLIPKGIEMFVRLSDYNKIVSQLKRFDAVIERVEEIERMHTELQDVHDKFTERLETTLTEMEEIKEELSSKLGPMK
ncbi:hypothetical protein E2P64_00080 [Candidatus Bathyarchaeota archaeon]|nr:hypothetical protein E2P64_00080 [Candidatus Bathyarchaeota archaeon]